MRNILFSFAMILYVTSALVNPALAKSKKVRIAVLDFQVQGEVRESADMGKIVAEWLITALVQEGRFDVIERRLLKKVLEEQKMGVTGLVDESSASKLGKVLGAKIVISGSVMAFHKVMEVNARIIEVESSSIIAAENVKSSNTAKLEDLVVRMAEKIIKDFPLEGYIVVRDADKILIDLGKRTGVKPGMRFIVFKEGLPIKHPKTGEILDIQKIQMGSIEIAEVKRNTSDAVIIEETTPNAIASGQLVKSMTQAGPRVRPRRQKQQAYAFKALPLTGASLDSDIRAVNERIENVRRLKDSRNVAWKREYKITMRELKVLNRRYRRSPAVYLSYAKLFDAIGKMPHAYKWINKAKAADPQYIEAYVFKGDMHYGAAMKLLPKKRRRSGHTKRARKAYTAALKVTSDKNTHATLYLRIGNVYADLSSDPENAKKYWQKAVSAAPGSAAARSANQRLSAS